MRKVQLNHGKNRKKIQSVRGFDSSILQMQYIQISGLQMNNTHSLLSNITEIPQLMNTEETSTWDRNERLFRSPEMNRLTMLVIF